MGLKEAEAMRTRLVCLSLSSSAGVFRWLERALMPVCAGSEKRRCLCRGSTVGINDCVCVHDSDASVSHLCCMAKPATDFHSGIHMKLATVTYAAVKHVKLIRGLPVVLCGWAEVFKVAPR